MPKAAPKTAVIHCRVSSTGQRDADTIEAQIPVCRSIVERFGLRLLPYGAKRDGWIIDDGISGTRLRNRDFKRFVDDVHAGKVRPDYLVVANLARMFRPDTVSDPERVRESLHDEAELRSALLRGEIQILDASGVTDPRDLLSYAVKSASVAQDYKQRRVDMDGGKRRLFAAGRVAKGGRAPYGYCVVPANGTNRNDGYTYAPDREDAPRLKELLAWYIEGGPTHAARKATAKKFPTPMHRTTKRKNKAKDWTPTRWSPVSVQHIVRNVRAYLGETTYKYAGKPYTIRYPALIDSTTYAAVERRKKERSLKHPRQVKLTTGFVDCECGEHLHARNGHGVHYSRCPAGCGSIREHAFSTALWNVVMSRLVTIRDHERAVHREKDPYGKQLETAKATLASARTEIAKLLDLSLKGTIDDVVWTKKNEELNDRRAAAQAEVERIERAREEHAQRQANRQDVASRVNATLRQITRPGGVSLEVKRRVLADLLNGERVIVRWPPKKAADECSPFALIMFPTFGAPPFKARTDQLPWCLTPTPGMLVVGTPKGTDVEAGLAGMTETIEEAAARIRAK